MIKKWLISLIQKALYTECVVYEYGVIRRIGTYQALFPPTVGSILQFENRYGVVNSVDFCILSNFRYYSVIVKFT
jgi:hypothetical protein